MNDNASNEEYDFVNKAILRRFRNCLAHGRLSIGNIDINNSDVLYVCYYSENGGGR